MLNYYKLREQPFGVTPDPRYLYSSATHREALASLLYGVEAGRGFVALIAKPGMGKTTLLFHALTQLQDRAKVVFLFQTIRTAEDFLRALLTDLSVQQTQGSLVDLQSKLNEVVTEQSRSGKPLVVILDEAQNLCDSVLEQVRMLSNFETSREKLIQIVLSGQPQLANTLASPELVQLRQRVSILASLKPFSPQETALYIDHRLRMAGYRTEIPLFTDSALALIAECSQGIPRNINNLCFNALSLGCALKRTTISCDIIREVVADLDLDPLRDRRSSATLSEKRDAPTTPASIYAAGAPAMRTGRFPELGIACAVLLILCGSLFFGHRWADPPATVRANSAIPSAASANSPSFSAKKTPRLAASVHTIRVVPGESLYRICSEGLTGCSSKRLQEIRTLNPWLSNLDHIEPGQEIRVPVVQEVSEANQSVAEKPRYASAAERDKQ